MVPCSQPEVWRPSWGVFYTPGRPLVTLDLRNEIHLLRNKSPWKESPDTPASLARPLNSAVLWTTSPTGNAEILLCPEDKRHRERLWVMNSCSRNKSIPPLGPTPPLSKQKMCVALWRTARLRRSSIYKTRGVSVTASHAEGRCKHRVFIIRPSEPIRTGGRYTIINQLNRKKALAPTISLTN